MSDLINCSPNFNARTPGQLLSLTSHLSFGSNEKKSIQETTSQSIESNNVVDKNGKDEDLDSSMNTTKPHNESKMSGVTPFFSAEYVSSSSMSSSLVGNVSMGTDSLSTSYYTCSSSVENNKTTSGSYESMKIVDIKMLQKNVSLILNFKLR